MSREYDAVIIGSGPAGNAAAERIAWRGGRACVVEADRLGGVCVNWGCMPTKGMLASSELCHRLTRAGNLGLEVGGATVDGRAVMARTHRIVRDLGQAISEKLDGIEGVDVVAGRGRLESPTTVRVELADGGDRIIEAGAVLIASGSSPSRPGFLPWGSDRVMTNREMVEADDLPASVIVMGGGPLGCEFACLFAELGIRTVQVELADRLLSKLDPTASRQVARALQTRGVELHLSSSIESVQADGRGVTASLADRGRPIEAEALLVAVGRQPNTGQLGLAEVGVATDDNGIVTVDDHCRTNVPTVYAAGDCAETLRHSHLAARMGEVAADNIMGESSADDRCVVPVGVYTHPQVACVGLCGECPDRSREGEMAEYTYSYASGGTAMLLDRNEGLLKLLADPREGRIGGAVWVGPHAVDMVHEIALAMRNELTVAQVAETIHAHPSLQEALRGVAEDWQHGRPRADSDG